MVSPTTPSLKKGGFTGTVGSNNFMWHLILYHMFGFYSGVMYIMGLGLYSGILCMMGFTMYQIYTIDKQHKLQMKRIDEQLSAYAAKLSRKI